MLTITHIVTAETRDLERHFPHHNWAIIFGLTVILNTGYGIFTPSIYQFITTPKTEAQNSAQNCENDDRVSFVKT